MSEPQVHEYVCQVRWSDVDAYGHVNNVKYFEYFQESRIRFIGDIGARQDHVSRFVVARLAVDYKRPIFFRREPYVVRTRLVRLGTSSFDVEAEIVDGDVMLSRSQATVVGFDLGTQRSRKLAASEREALAAFLDD